MRNSVQYMANIINHFLALEFLLLLPFFLPHSAVMFSAQYTVCSVPVTIKSKFLISRVKKRTSGLTSYGSCSFGDTVLSISFSSSSLSDLVKLTQWSQLQSADQPLLIFGCIKKSHKVLHYNVFLLNCRRKHKRYKMHLKDYLYLEMIFLC